MASPYDSARSIFTEFRRGVLGNSHLQREIEDVVLKVFKRYNTTIRENRFIAGGVVEYLIVAAFNAVNDLHATHVGISQARSDIATQAHSLGISAHFSIKSSVIASGSIRLTNFLGEGVMVEWNEPTIFILPQGLVYGDVELIPDATKKSGDALVLNRKKLTAFIADNDDYFIPLKLPTRDDVVSIKESHTASEDIARELISGYRFLKL